MFSTLQARLRNTQGDARLFLAAIMAFGFGGAMLDALFNNYLAARFQIDGLHRTLLEIPRELPGLLVVFVSALFIFLPSRRLAAGAGWLSALGLLGLAFASPTFWIMTPWLFFYSMGQHMLMPIQSDIAMDLAKAGQAGKRLGQVNSLRNIAVIAGSALVFVIFRYAQLGFVTALLIAAASLGIAGYLFARMRPDAPHAQGTMLKLYPQYRMYYLLCVLFGTRKQIFLTFAPWVLVSIFEQPTARIAELLTLGAALGIISQPLIGRMVDRMGERFVLALEALLLIPVCMGYALASEYFSSQTALLIVAGCFLLDQSLMGFGMARSTWLKKIALEPGHVTPTLTMAVSIDHVFSIAIALLGGILWRTLGYQAVFAAGALVALLNLAAVLIGMRYTPALPTTD